MRIIVIGGCGHIGSYLVPKLVNAGYEVFSISRGQSSPYKEDIAWQDVNKIILDREKEDKGIFEKKILNLNPDIVIDLINFSLETTKDMVNVLKNSNIRQYIFCSSIWAHGKADIIPMIEDQPKYPLDEYGTEKAKCEKYLHELYYKEKFPETVIMPGQISGPGWLIMNPVANHDKDIFAKIKNGEEIAIPNFGMETLHHVHADDVAQVFFNSITHIKNALGESFHAVGDRSITLLEYAKFLFRYFRQNENIKLLSWDKWCEYTNNPDFIDRTYYHIARSGFYSIEKAKRLLEYKPKYDILETIQQSVEYMVKNNWI